MHNPEIAEALERLAQQRAELDAELDAQREAEARVRAKWQAEGEGVAAKQLFDAQTQIDPNNDPRKLTWWRGFEHLVPPSDDPVEQLRVASESLAAALGGFDVALRGANPETERNWHRAADGFRNARPAARPLWAKLMLAGLVAIWDEYRGRQAAGKPLRAAVLPAERRHGVSEGQDTREPQDGAERRSQPLYSPIASIEEAEADFDARQAEVRAALEGIGMRYEPPTPERRRELIGMAFALDRAARDAAGLDEDFLEDEN
ncbi:hypothetical protein GQE99_06525 [Maritimibacter sp. DP07]|uniref:Uncharacterized protein n=1 Tax=Maritimibacter harenae TaxID=2606218 RepID=A0A845M7V8_9RHOB|nr:hypothetical protein [Maritimibacter harenae]MZR12674.1 hypothetical protein [Maritimibacter harenae]